MGYENRQPIVHEHYYHQGPRSPRRHSINGSRKISVGSGGVVSRVLGSLRHRRHEEKEKAHQRRGRTTSFRGTHRPDRPHVDKRTKEPLSDAEYAGEIERMQERSQRHYELSNLTRPWTPPPSPPPKLQTSMPNFSYSSKSPKGTRESPTTPTFSHTQWQLQGDRAPRAPPSRGRTSLGSRAPSSPVSPGAVTIQVYRESIIDRGLPLRRVAEEASSECELEDEPLPLLPRKAFNPNESLTRRTLRRSGNSSVMKRHIPKLQVNTNLNAVQEPTTPIYTDLDVTAPGQLLNSSPTSPSRPRAATPSGNRNSRGRSPEPSLRMCVMPGCNEALITDDDREQNVCADCRKEYRQSTWDEVSDKEQPPAVKDADLETLRALVGDAVFNITETKEKGSERPVDGDGNSGKAREKEFKLQPAPRIIERRRQPQRDRRPPPAGSQSSCDEDNDDSKSRRKSSSTKGGTTRKTSNPLSSSSRNQHTNFQEALWTPPLPPPQQQQQQHHKKSPPRAKPVMNDEETLLIKEGTGTEGSECGPSRTGSPPSGGESWTTDVRAAESSSDDDANSLQNSGWAGRNVLKVDGAASLVKSDSNSNSDSNSQGNKESKESKESNDSTRPASVRITRQASRDTVLYQEIDEIIDCYTMIAEMGVEENARRKAEAVASFFATEPIEVEMRRKGFI
ncbi:hypothetical protein F4677DRAFT_144266 [Hypoxylon crocopeplum]|nr:hypothetical protein F4677DRAFT_144266 [Hypoxylon crocopeplum]